MPTLASLCEEWDLKEYLLNHLAEFCRTVYGHIYSYRLMQFGSSKLQMYMETWLPSNPQEQLIYSIIHLVIALSQQNSTFPRQYLEKITSI